MSEERRCFLLSTANSRRGAGPTINVTIDAPAPDPGPAHGDQSSMAAGDQPDRLLSDTDHIDLSGAARAFSRNLHGFGACS